jgi:hypothetical protein
MLICLYKVFQYIRFIRINQAFMLQNLKYQRSAVKASVQHRDTMLMSDFNKNEM